MYFVLTCNQHSSSIYMLKKIRKGSLSFDKLGTCKNSIVKPMNAKSQSFQLKEVIKDIWCIRWYRV